MAEEGHSDNGQPDRFIPTDLFQEHNNLLIKTIHSAKGSNASWKYLGDKISTNIFTFKAISAKVLNMFSTSYISGSHTSSSTSADIHKLMESIESHGIFGMERREEYDDVNAVTDLYFEGTKKISESARIPSFKVSNSCWQADDDDHDLEMEEDEEEEEEEELLTFDIEDYVHSTN